MHGQLAKRDVIVMYLNVRPIGDTNSYPPRDNIPASILTTLDDSAENYTDRCVAFFHALFDTMRSTLKDLSKLGAGRVEVVKTWSKIMCEVSSPSRTMFFAQLQTKFDAVSLFVADFSSAISTFSH